MTDPETERRMEARILQQLYEPYFTSFDGADLRSLPEQEGWSRVTFDNLLNQMSRAKLIRSHGAGYRYMLTGAGAVRAEEEGVALAEFVRANQRIRTDILLALAEVYETRGRLYSKFKRELETELGIDQHVATANVMVLDDLGYAEPAENGCQRITDRGLAGVKEYRKKRGIADEFEKVSAMAPQPRGRALQKLIARLIKQQGWETDEGVRSSHEEIDVIIWREREYYLLECKWEKDPIEASVVRELFGKLGNRIGVNGIVMSMSGFTKGAAEQASDFAGQRMLLLFGEDAIKRMVYGVEPFTDLLDAKYRQLTTKRRIDLT